MSLLGFLIHSNQVLPLQDGVEQPQHEEKLQNYGPSKIQKYRVHPPPHLTVYLRKGGLIRLDHCTGKCPGAIHF